MCFSQIYECLVPTAANGIPRLRQSIKALELLCKNETSLDITTKSHLRFVFERFDDLVKEQPSVFGDNGYTRVKTFSPIELVAVSVLFSQKGAERNKGMLKGDILALRSHLREKHWDLRMNGDVWGTAWNFIDNLESIRGTADGSTIRKRAVKKGAGGTAMARTRTNMNSERESVNTTNENIPHQEGPRSLPASRGDPILKVEAEDQEDGGLYSASPGKRRRSSASSSDGFQNIAAGAPIVNTNPNDPKQTSITNKSTLAAKKARLMATDTRRT